MLQVSNLTVTFDGKPVLSELDLRVEPGSITAVMGPSGCGKTTLLRAIAGLQVTDGGSIWWASKPLDGLRPDQRNLGLMFQDNALFPHRSVAGNVAFGLEMRGLARPQIDDRVREALAMVDLADLSERPVDRLSGGEQQRVALARALAPEPELLMLDEPLASLDRNLRDQLLVDMRVLFQQLDITVLYVTHDRDEVFTIADDLQVMDDGRIVGSGSAERLWSHPGTEFIARFLGHQNILTARVSQGSAVVGGVAYSIGGSPEETPDGSQEILVPTEAVHADAQGSISLTVSSVLFRSGIHTTTGLLEDGQALVFTGGPFAIGATVRVTIEPDRLVSLQKA